MKKVTAAIFITVLILTVSCVSNPVDMGIHNPENIPEEDFVAFYSDGYCKIERIDNYEIDSWPADYHKDKMIKLTPGVHTIFSRFENGRAHTNLAMPVTAKFEKGNMYYMDYDIETDKLGSKVIFQILLYNNKKKGKEVTGQRMENLIEKFLFHKAFIEAPINQGKPVKLENKKYTLIFMADGIYTQTDKESGVTVKGKLWFDDHDIITTALGMGFWVKMYMFDADAKIMKKSTSWGRKEYEEVDYKLAHTVLVLVNITDNEVIYRYEKPAELKGTEITFNITEVK